MEVVEESSFLQGLYEALGASVSFLEASEQSAWIFLDEFRAFPLFALSYILRPSADTPNSL